MAYYTLYQREIKSSEQRRVDYYFRPAVAKIRSPNNLIKKIKY